MCCCCCCCFYSLVVASCCLPVTRQLVFNQRNHNGKKTYVCMHTALNAGIMAAKNNVCNMCVYASMRASMRECVRVLLLSPYFRYTNMAYQLSQKRARSKLRYTNTLAHTEATYTLYTHTPVSNERKKVRAHPFRALNFKKRKSKQMAKLAHKQTGPPACVWVGQLYVDQCCAALVVPLFFFTALLISWLVDSPFLPHPLRVLPHNILPAVCTFYN